MDFAWVVEHAFSDAAAPMYFTGYFPSAHSLNSWSRNHLDALRFARFCDAKRVALQLDPVGRHRVAEHGWAK
jgi:hypothetical protein